MLRIKRILTLAIITLALAWVDCNAQSVALKTNTLYWLAGGTINGGIEFSTSRKVTFELLGAYNPWTFKDNKKMHFWLAQPEVKFWLCEKFEGHFFGLHGFGGQFAGGFDKYRYDDGVVLGGGLSYGYDWILSPHWNIEAEIGIGYAHLRYKQSDRVPCIKCQEKKHKNYVGPTKASVSIVYVF